MKQLLSISLILLLLSACQKNDTPSDNIFSDTQWKSSNFVYYNDIKNNLSSGYILDFISNDNFLIEYHDRKLNDGTQYIVPSITGSYYIDGNTLQLNTGDIKILYTLFDDHMELSYSQSQLSSKYDIDFPETMYLSKDGGKSAGDLLTGKKWRIASICVGDSYMQADLWDGNFEERDKSLQALIDPNNYILQYNGNKEWLNNENKGQFSANVIGYTINGTWHANAMTGSHYQSFEKITSESNDKFENLFLIGMNNVYRFDSNGYSLTLYFVYDQKDYNMRFTYKTTQFK